MMVVAGVAPDLDYVSYFGGAGAFLRYHRTLLHSIPAAALLSCAVAGTFLLLANKKRAKDSLKPAAPLTFATAFTACAVGAASHILLDLASGEGMQLLWPFRVHWTAGGLVANFDLWVLVLLLAGLLIPQLFSLVGDEIGGRKKGAQGAGAAIFTLLLLALYFGSRADLHSRATGLLLSSEYHGREPLAAGAFPSSVNALDWRGVVATDNTIEEVDVPLSPGANFQPDDSLTHYKPQESPALDAAEKTSAAQAFLKYAEFPLASVSRHEDGYRFDLRDARFPDSDASPANIVVRADLNSSYHVTRQEFRYASSSNP
jgi:inner membrane protein